jgi:hypothetical protein
MSDFSALGGSPDGIGSFFVCFSAANAAAVPIDKAQKRQTNPTVIFTN